MYFLVLRYVFLFFLILKPIYSETQENQEETLTPLLSVEIFRYQYAQNTNDHVIIDWAMLLDQVNNKNLVEDIDGNITFMADKVKVGIILPETFSYLSENDEYMISSSVDFKLISSFYSDDLNKKINQALLEEVKKLQPNEFFNFKPYEFIPINFDNRRTGGFSALQYLISDDYSTCYKDIQEFALEYDVLIAPACFFDYSGNMLKEDSLTIVGYYNREKLIPIAQSKINAEEKEYLAAVENNPDHYSWLLIGDGGPLCTIETIPQIKLDAAIINKWEGYYSPWKFVDVNEIFIEITQRKEKECFGILLNLEDKQRLMKALNNKQILFKDLKNIIDPDKLDIGIINNFYSEINIFDENFYNFFINYNRDMGLFKKLSQHDINNQKDLDELINKISLEAPSLSNASNQDIFDFLNLSEQALEMSITVSELIKINEQREKELAQKAAEERIQQEKEYINQYPYYAVISCGFSGTSMALAACFAGFDGLDTTISLTNGINQTEKKHWEFDQIGYFEYDQLYIDLEKNFYLMAQNSSDSLTLSLELFDRSTGNLILKEEASSLYGVVQAVTPY